MTAIALAKQAGLVPFEEPVPIATELMEWFRANLEPLFESGLEDQLDATTAGLEAEHTEAYYQRRATRAKKWWQHHFHMRAFHAVRDHPNAAPKWDVDEARQGLFTYQWQGKLYRSWFSDQPLMEPRQMVAYIQAKHGFDLDVQVYHSGYTKTNSGGYSIVGGAMVPTYRCYITMKLPNWLRTVEDAYITYGKVVDRDEACELAKQLNAGTMSREQYSERIAKLCREAPVDPDAVPNVWLELDRKGEVVEFDEDDTRNRPGDLGPEYLYIEDDSGQRRRTKSASAYEWEDDRNALDLYHLWQMTGSTYGFETSAYDDPEVDEDFEIEQMLGLDSAEIERTCSILGEDASAQDIMINTRRKAKAIVSCDDMIVEF